MNGLDFRNVKVLSYIKKNINDDEWSNFVKEFDKNVKDVGIDNIDLTDIFLMWRKKRLRIKKLNTLNYLT